MKKTEGQTIAQEVWNMIPDEAKKQMKGVKKSFMESVAADVDAVMIKSTIEKQVSILSKMQIELIHPKINPDDYNTISEMIDDLKFFMVNCKSCDF